MFKRLIEFLLRPLDRRIERVSGRSATNAAVPDGKKLTERDIEERIMRVARSAGLSGSPQA